MWTLTLPNSAGAPESILPAPFGWNFPWLQRVYSRPCAQLKPGGGMRQHREEPTANPWLLPLSVPQFPLLSPLRILATLASRTPTLIPQLSFMPGSTCIPSCSMAWKVSQAISSGSYSAHHICFPSQRNYLPLTSCPMSENSCFICFSGILVVEGRRVHLSHYSILDRNRGL